METGRVCNLHTAQVVKYRARLHHKLGQAERAVTLLEAFLCQFPDAADLTHINMLAELYMEAGRCAPARPQGTCACMPLLWIQNTRHAARLTPHVAAASCQWRPACFTADITWLVSRREA